MLALPSLLWAVAPELARAQNLVLVTHPSVTLSATDVRDVYLGDKQLAGAIKLVPVDNSSSQEMFLARVVRIEGAKYASLWTKKSFREGILAPPLKGSDAEVLAFVRRTPGAVGYVGAPAAGVAVVQP